SCSSCSSDAGGVQAGADRSSGASLLRRQRAQRLGGAGLGAGCRPGLDVRARRPVRAAAVGRRLRPGGAGHGAAALRSAHHAGRAGGVRAGDLRDVAREKGLAAFVVAGTFGDLSEQLARGRPVLVGLATPMTGGRALAHYEVVVAIDRRDGRLLTLDPGRGLREDSLAGFAREWAPTGRVTLIVFRPESADGRAS